jgi:hypothetical protein
MMDSIDRKELDKWLTYFVFSKYWMRSDQSQN